MGTLGAILNVWAPFTLHPSVGSLGFQDPVGIFLAFSEISDTDNSSYEKWQFLARHYQATIQGCAKPRMVTHDLAVASDKFQI